MGPWAEQQSKQGPELPGQFMVAPGPARDGPQWCHWNAEESLANNAEAPHAFDVPGIAEAPELSQNSGSSSGHR
jgi:hypothetical protein